MHPLISLPKPCSTGDRVAIIAPSSPFVVDLLEAGCMRLREWGLEPTFSPRILDRWGYLAGTDEARRDVFVEAFTDPSIRAVICARGGSGAVRIIDQIPWDVIAKHPKRFLGFSDVTMLHTALRKTCSFVSFHGPMAASRLFLTGSEDSVARVKSALFASSWSELCPPIPGKMLQSGTAQGRLIGGNMTVLLSTLGTPWQPDFEGAIVCLEDIGELPYKLDRMSQQFKMAGVWDKIAGLVLGDFGELSDTYAGAYDVESFWRERLPLPKHCPILYDAPIGHIRENVTLPMGALAELNADAGTLTIVDPT